MITGPRRAGKSTLCHALLKEKKFAYINFDDENLVSLKREELNIVLKEFYEIYEKPEFIFLDEIQNINGWELFVNRLKRLKFNIIITGSNSKLLSKELSSHLTGRHLSLELFPFSFREFLSYYKIDFSTLNSTTRNSSFIKKQLLTYINCGGFPESYEEPNAKRYLTSLYSSIVTKDIIIRNKIKYANGFRELSHYLVSNFSCRITFNKLKNIFNFKSTHTIKDYVSFLEESYLIFLIEKFDFKLKERISSPRKVYAIDTGFPIALSSRISDDLGRLYENMVAIELMRRKAIAGDFKVYYWQDQSNREVDFVLKKETIIVQLIQVSFDIEQYETRIRESRSLIKASRELNCNNLLIITENKEGEEKIEENEVRYVPLWKWLLDWSV